MVGEISLSSETELFDTLVTMTRTDSTLSSKFSKSQFHEFEPNLKDMSVKIPLIVYSIPDNESEFITLQNADTEETYTVPGIMWIDYKARSKVREYVARLKRAIENNDSDLNALGYYDVNVEFISSEPGLVDQKQLIETEFNINLKGIVKRS